MLDVEMLVCENPKYHKDCRWVHSKLRYPDERYLLVKHTLMKEAKRSHIAYRITHWKLGVLTTIKFGHDGKIFVSDNLDQLRKFAVL